MKGVGCENSFVFDDVANRHAFLAMNEDRKAKCGMQCELNKTSNILKELNRVWNVDISMTGSYAEDYDIIKNNHATNHQTAWTDKYTTVIFDEETALEFEWRQPIPDYVHWYLTGGEQHYMTFEEQNLLPKKYGMISKSCFCPPRFWIYSIREGGKLAVTELDLIVSHSDSPFRKCPARQNL